MAKKDMTPEEWDVYGDSKAVEAPWHKKKKTTIGTRTKEESLIVYDSDILTDETKKYLNEFSTLKSTNNGDEWFLLIPDDEEDLEARYPDAPEKIHKVIASAIKQKTKTSNRCQWLYIY